MSGFWNVEHSAHGDGEWFVSVSPTEVRVIAPPGVLVQRSERQTGPVGWRLAIWSGQARLGRRRPSSVQEVTIEQVLEWLPPESHADVRRLLRSQLSTMRSRVVATSEVVESDLARATTALKRQIEAASGDDADEESPLGGGGALPVGIPVPRDFAHIGLAATATLRRGPTSPLAQLLRELSPYLLQYQPHLYALEGTFRTILMSGLLRQYPVERLHCVAPGRLGGMVDLGAGLVGEDATGLEAAFGAKHREAATLLDLDYKLDCLIYLIDPMVATSTLPATLTVKRECTIAGKLLFDNVPSAVEWFSLVGSTSGGKLVRQHELTPRLRNALGYLDFPHRAISLVAVDAKKAEMLDFVRENLAFLRRFETRSATAATGRLLNGKAVDDEMRDGLSPEQQERLLAAAAALREELVNAGITTPWINELQSGNGGGYLQIAESLTMGLSDSTLFFRDPKAPDVQDGAELLDRAPLISNYGDRLSAGSGQMFVRDRPSADGWAKLWSSLPEGASPTTLAVAFRERLGVQLVLAEPRDSAREQWEAIAEEAAWYLLSAIGANRPDSARGQSCQRVTVACGSAMQKVIEQMLDPVAFDLVDRIKAQHQRQAAAVARCKELFPQQHRVIDHISRRKRLTLQAGSTNVAALWSIGPVVVGPMVGTFGSTRRSVEASHNAALLADLLEGEALPLATSAYVSGTTDVPVQMTRHWATTDFILMACDDLAVSWFGRTGKVRLPGRMYVDLFKKSAVGEIAGLYLDAKGEQVTPDEYVRQGMRLADIQRVANSPDGAAIMIAGAHQPIAGERPRRVTTVLAALKAGAVSVLVTDPGFAGTLLDAHASELFAEDSIAF